MNLTARIGKKVYNAREDLDMQQKELAYKVCIHKTGISHLEAGRKLPHLSVLLRICSVLKLSPNELIGWNDHEVKIRTKRLDARTADRSG